METIVETKYGKLQGIEKNGCIQFLGVPFSKKPLDDLAFRYPKEVEKWDGVLDASKGSANPIQHVGHTGYPFMSRDCLYLNLFVPKTDEKNLSVMVWLFGGSYAEGGVGAKHENSDELLYDFSKLACEQNVIVVTVNYRLNLYGFLNLHFLSDRFDSNIGLFDIIQSLRFIKETIADFNGNSENVTLFGQSAGAACILALMSMSEAENLFQKSIVMSACVEHFFTEEESERNTKEYLKLLKIKENELEKLFDLSIEQVDLANKKFSRYMRFKKLELRCAFSPVIDKITLKDEPKKLCVNCTKPLLMGTVKEEANPFVLLIPKFALFILAKLLHLKIAKRTRENNRDFKHRVSDEISNIIYVKPMNEILSSYKGKFTRYLYTYIPQDAKNRGIGCFHFSEVPVLMGKSVRVLNVDDEESQKVGQKMRRLFATFAKTGIDDTQLVVSNS